MGNFRFLTSGESHGRGLNVIVEGVPAGLPLTEDYLRRDMERRQKGYGRGGRMKIEKDEAKIIAGVRHGLTLGSPISLWVQNRDWVNWEHGMSPDPLGRRPPRGQRPRTGDPAAARPRRPPRRGEVRPGRRTQHP